MLQKSRIWQTIILLSSFSLYSACSPSNGGSQEVGTDTLTVEDIEGVWECIYSVYDHSDAQDDGSGRESFVEDAHTPSLIIIENGELWSFDYPCEFIVKQRIVYKGLSLFKVGTDNSNNEEFTVNENKLTRQIGIHQIEYTRTQVSDSIIETLKRDSLNIDCITTTWILQRHYVPETSEDTITLNIPFEIPDTLHISLDDVGNSSSDYMLTLETSLGPREFHYNYKYFWASNKHEISLAPTGWWGDSPLLITYYRY